METIKEIRHFEVHSNSIQEIPRVTYLPHVFRMPCIRKREEVNLVWGTPFFHNLEAMHAHKTYDKLQQGARLMNIYCFLIETLALTKGKF